MTSQRLVVILFRVAGLLFLLASLIPLFRGAEFNVVFFLLGTVFLILSVAFGKSTPS